MYVLVQNVALSARQRTSAGRPGHHGAQRGWLGEDGAGGGVPGGWLWRRPVRRASGVGFGDAGARIRHQTQKEKPAGNTREERPRRAGHLVHSDSGGEQVAAVACGGPPTELRGPCGGATCRAERCGGGVRVGGRCRSHLKQQVVENNKSHLNGSAPPKMMFPLGAAAALPPPFA